MLGLCVCVCVHFSTLFLIVIFLFSEAQLRDDEASNNGMLQVTKQQ